MYQALIADAAPTNGRTQQPTVVVVSDDPAVSDRIGQLLDAERIHVAVKTGGPDRISRFFSEDSETVAILSYGAADADAMIRAVKDEAPGVRVVLVARQGDDRRALSAALRARADAVIYLDQLDDALGPSVRAVIADQVVFPRRDRRRVDVPALSHREREVLRLAVSGFTNDEIARQLFLATSTVKSHLTSVFGKLSVRSRSEAAALVLDPTEPIGRVILASNGGGLRGSDEVEGEANGDMPAPLHP